MLTSHSALNGDWPALAMQKGNEEAVYQLLVRLKQVTESRPVASPSPVEPSDWQMYR